MSPIARRKTTPLKTLAAVAAVTLAGAGPQALAQTIFVKGGTLIDGTGAAPTKDARILIQDGVIKGVWSGDEGGGSRYRPESPWSMRLESTSFRA